MITAVDTNILLDVLNPTEPHSDASKEALARASRAGTLVATEIVYAELCPNFSRQADLDDFLRETSIGVESLKRQALHSAGLAWAAYTRRREAPQICHACGSRLPSNCAECGATLKAKQHVLADFIIGAHASTQADRLITRDKGYYRTYFPDLHLV